MDDMDEGLTALGTFLGNVERDLAIISAGLRRSVVSVRSRLEAVEDMAKGTQVTTEQLITDQTRLIDACRDNSDVSRALVARVAVIEGHVLQLTARFERLLVEQTLAAERARRHTVCPPPTPAVEEPISCRDCPHPMDKHRSHCMAILDDGYGCYCPSKPATP